MRTEAFVWSTEIFERHCDNPLLVNAQNNRGHLCELGSINRLLGADSRVGEPRDRPGFHKTSYRIIVKYIRDEIRILRLETASAEKSGYRAGDLATGETVTIAESCRPRDPAHRRQRLSRHGRSLEATVPYSS